MQKYNDYAIFSHGYVHSQYFQGYGTGGCDYVFTGCGYTERDAYEDACEQAYQTIPNVSLPKKPRGINAKNHVPAKVWQEDMNEVYWYVSIRVNMRAKR